jgi:L-alanine-DL-glutamate epimerase-like enolase superfamily enzyme
MKIVDAERIALDIPFYADHVTRHMQRARTHSERVFVYRVVTDNDIVGWGDSLAPHDTDAVVGRGLFDVLLNDDIGLGLQVAVTDAAGKAVDSPAHALLGTKLRDRCPISWWDIDMPPEDWIAEAQEAMRRGYTSFKMKARPWRDIHDQIEQVGNVVSSDFKFDIDFNGFLLNEAAAETVLHKLDAHPNVGIFETPFRLMQDIAGAGRLRHRIRKPIVEHFREELVKADCCDGFVIGRGITEFRKEAALATACNKPFWIQQVGTGITTAFVTHLGAVLSHAQHPAITCHELWESDLLSHRLEVRDGYIDVSDAPGLGIEVDESAIARYRVDENEPDPKTKYRAQKRILRVHWPGDSDQHRIWSFTDEDCYQDAFYAGNLPGFQPGVSLEYIEDDGSTGFNKEHDDLIRQGL